VSDRRKEQRRLTYIGGRASFFHGRSSADLLIRNTSASGAKLIVQNSNFIPDKFDLMIPMLQAEFSVCACWRRYNEIGVEFERAHIEGMPAPL
jgi:hypothetical protein